MVCSSTLSLSRGGSVPPLVRPHLDYAVQFWFPHYYKNDVGLLESVQRRMIKKIQGMRDIPYGRRLRLLSLDSLERGRLRGNLKEVLSGIGVMTKGMEANFLGSVTRMEREITGSV